MPAERFKKLYTCCEKADLLESKVIQIEPICPEPPKVSNWFWGGVVGGMVLGFVAAGLVAK